MSNVAGNDRGIIAALHQIILAKLSKKLSINAGDSIHVGQLWGLGNLARIG
jgi:hypothetical protein